MLDVKTKKEGQGGSWVDTNGRCVGCGSADYTQVCYRGKPKYGPAGLYCDPCFQDADISPFGDDPFDH